MAACNVGLVVFESYHSPRHVDCLSKPLLPFLLQLICEKPTVINDYESGRAIPANAIIAKIERALATRLPRSRK